MSPEIFNALYDDARSALATSNIFNAITAIEGMLTSVSNWEDVEEVRDIRANYNAMLDYLCQGTADPSRDAMRQKFLQRLIIIMEKTRRNYELNNSPLPVARAYHCLRTTHASMDMLADGLTPIERFNAVWCSRPWTEEDTERMLMYLLPQQGSEEPALIVSAVMLAVLTYFDPCKLQFLCHLCQEPDEHIADRALVGVLLCYVIHEDLIPQFPELQQAANEIVANDALRHRIVNIQELLLSAQCTPEVNRKLEKHYEELMRSAHADKLNDIKALGSSIKKVFGIFVDIQAHGADMNFNNFKNLYKLSDDFFQKTANWFYPFTYRHPDIVNVTIPETLCKLFELKRHTATDKYAFVLMLRNGKVEINGMQDAEGHTINTDDLPVEKEEDGDLKYYIFDLYRYFTLYPKAKDQKNPFAENLLLIKHPLFQKVFANEDTQKTIAKKLLAIKNYTDAIPLLEFLAEAHPESAWTLQQLSLCHEELGDLDAAYDYINAAAIYKPDNEKLQHKMVSLLIRAEREKEALPIIYKLYYEVPADIHLLRCLAWCTLKAGDLNESIGYFTSLTASSEAQPFDFQNFGHARLLSGDLASAISLYLLAAQARDDDETATPLFDFLFASDAKWIIARGISPAILRLVSDAVLHNLSPLSQS